MLQTSISPSLAHFLESEVVDIDCVFSLFPEFVIVHKRGKMVLLAVVDQDVQVVSLILYCQPQLIH